ncbi:hypothetical protein KXD40_002272 [Peronospora effusa]|uniref:Uncharacterized protein n=1 Tax=Peronospora effusa TaxID=542832 RepID=A0A3R7YZS3_9STRA|nr:hypothetical protein DD237_003797 [Peronospora effusa]UIZ27013.1 hypothetical protein KXD40_002272 [Peronospora effusa]
MLRAQVHQDDDTDELDDFIAVTVPLSPSNEQEKESLCRIDEEFLWLLLLAAVAECVTTCFMPGYTLYTWGLNVDGTVLNWIGPFLAGLSYGYEDYSKGSETSLVCVQFRSAFLGVLTSYSFMADHAGDLSSHSFAAGPLYICVSIGGGCGCFCLGKQVAAAACTHPVTATVSRVVGTMKNRPSLMTSLVTFVGVTTLRAALGAHGFVRRRLNDAGFGCFRDPKDPQFIGQVQVADGEELVLGMLLSCSAVLLSNYVCGFFPRQPLQLHTAISRSNGVFIDWGCLCCNFLASVLTGFTYQLSLLSSTRVTKNLLALKFVSSFCGSLSVFSGAVSIISRLWLAGNRRSALWNFLLQLLVGLVCIPYLYKHVAT